MEAGRGPCPYCRELVDTRASVCPHCRRNVLLDLVIAQPVSDPRLRYNASRRLFELKLGPTLAELLERLERARPLVRGVTLETAFAALEILTNAGIQAVTKPSDAKPERQPRKVIWVLVGVAAVLFSVVLILSVSWVRHGSTGVGSLSPSGLAFGAPSPRTIAARALDSVVSLSCREGSGSGFFVSETTLITNEHVTCGPDERLDVVTRDGAKGTARVSKSSKYLDAAVLEVEGLRGKPLTVESAGDLAAGDPAMLIGSPVGLESTFHVGTISNPRRIVLDLCYLQLDAGVNPGNSGGPVLDGEGRVVGIVSLKRSDAEGIGLALPVDYLYQGKAPLLKAPANHPTPGFTAMLERAEKEVEKLQKERTEVGFRLVKALRRTRTGVLAFVVTTSSFEPRSSLDFKLESDGNSCRISANLGWKLSDPSDPFAERARDFMRDRGLGQVYVGTAQLDFSGCSTPPGPSAELVLCEGDETTNRVEL